jgi:hypothetical protein
MRWMDGVEKDLRNLSVVNWRAKAHKRGMSGESSYSRPRPTKGFIPNNKVKLSQLI